MPLIVLLPWKRRSKALGISAQCTEERRQNDALEQPCNGACPGLVISEQGRFALKQKRRYLVGGVERQRSVPTWRTRCAPRRRVRRGSGNLSASADGNRALVAVGLGHRTAEVATTKAISSEVPDRRQEATIGVAPSRAAVVRWLAIKPTRLLGTRSGCGPTSRFPVPHLRRECVSWPPKGLGASSRWSSS